LQELEETLYWIELLTDSGIVPAGKLADLIKECGEITAILVASVKTAKGRKQE